MNHNVQGLFACDQMSYNYRIGQGRTVVKLGKRPPLSKKRPPHFSFRPSGFSPICFLVTKKVTNLAKCVKESRFFRTKYSLRHRESFFNYFWSNRKYELW